MDYDGTLPEAESCGYPEEKKKYENETDTQKLLKEKFVFVTELKYPLFVRKGWHLDNGEINLKSDEY